MGSGVCVCVSVCVSVYNFGPPNKPVIRFRLYKILVIHSIMPEVFSATNLFLIFRTVSGENIEIYFFHI